MKELINFIESKKSMTIINLDENELTVKWGIDGAGFYLHITKEEIGKYKFDGEISLVSYTSEIIEATVWRRVDSEKEMIALLEELIEHLIGMATWIKYKRMYGE